MLNVTMNLYILSFVSIEEAQYADKFWKFHYVILFSVFCGAKNREIVEW